MNPTAIFEVEDVGVAYVDLVAEETPNVKLCTVEYSPSNTLRQIRLCHLPSVE